MQMYLKNNVSLIVKSANKDVDQLQTYVYRFIFQVYAELDDYDYDLKGREVWQKEIVREIDDLLEIINPELCIDIYYLNKMKAVMTNCKFVENIEKNIVKKTMFWYN